MASRGRRDGRERGRTGAGRDRTLEWPRIDRLSALAVTLSLLTLLSLFAVPVAGSTGTGGAASVDTGTVAPAMGGGNSSAGGSSTGNGGASAGGGQGGQSNGEAGGGQVNGNAGGSQGGQSKGEVGGGQSNGNAGGSQGGQANGNAGGGQGGQANGNAGGIQGEQASGKSGGSKGGESPGKSGGSAPKGPSGGSAVDVYVDVGSIGGPGSNGGGNDPGGPPGQSNAGGSGPPGAGGPPDEASAGGSGSGAGGPPARSNAGGNSPTVSVSPGGRDGTPAGGASGSPGSSSVVSVSVRDARPGDHLELDVSSSEAEGDAVAFQGISVTVKRGGDFSMQVTNSRERLPGSPAFEPDQAAEALGRVRLDHSITNDEVEEVSYSFRVSKGHLRATDTDPEEVALFRYADGDWSELPTDVVGETPTHYLLSSDSPGMSEFAIGAKRPDFDTFWADVDAGSVASGDTVTVRGRVTNDGGADGVYDARLVVDGETVARRSITIAAGGTRQINFETEMDRPGAREVSINGVPAGEVSVQAQPTDSSRDETDTPMTVLIDRLLDLGHALDVPSPPTNAEG